MIITLLVVRIILSDGNCFELNIVDQHNKLSIKHTLCYTLHVCVYSLLACLLNYNLMSSADQCESIGNSPAAKNKLYNNVTHYVSLIYIDFRFTYMDASGTSCGYLLQDRYGIVAPG